MLLNVTALFECDKCGCQCWIEIDVAQSTPPGWTLFELAEDALRGAIAGSYSDDKARCVGGSIQQGKHLCQECTYRADNARVLPRK